MDVAPGTAILTIADFAYVRANLEHAAASSVNLLQAPLLIVLLGIALFAALGPDVTIFQIHPGTAAIFVSYLYALLIVARQQHKPMWTPRSTRETVHEEDGDDVSQSTSLRRLWFTFVPLALVTGGAGWFVAQSGIAIAATTGLSGTAVGGLFTALVTSTPELVTTIAAVRRGALNLAVGGIIGGNAFDTLFLGASDIAFRDGSIYHAVQAQQLLLIVLALIMTGVMVMGMVGRQEQGIGGIGWESAVVLALYVAGFALILSM